jgi:hypothetical protein
MNKFNLNKKEERIFQKLNSPQKIQDFLDRMPINFEKQGETCLSPREVLKQNRAHCIEAAYLAAAILWHHGQKPLLLDLVTTDGDFDHVVCLFKVNGFWGAISKSNHAVLLYRDPIYKTVRELVLSYFHEYFLDNGKKTLRTYSAPFDLRKYGTDWITLEKSLLYIADDLDGSKHFNILNKKQIAALRKADKIAIKAGLITAFKSR